MHEVLRWTGGHPYLTIQLCDKLVKSGATTAEDVTGLVDKWYGNHDAVRSDVHFETVSRFFDPKVGRVNDPITALMLYRRIWRGRREPDQMTPEHIQLKLAGIVKRDGYGYIVVRNAIYRQIFTENWATTAIEMRKLEQTAPTGPLIIPLRRATVSRESGGMSRPIIRTS